MPAAALREPGRQALKEYVAKGGGLVVAGGPFAAAEGSSDLAFLQDVLPVTEDGPGGALPTPRRGWVVPAAHPLTAGLFLAEKPVMPAYHRLTPKPGATVVMTVDGTPPWSKRRSGQPGLPLIVLNAYGQGRVVALGAAPVLLPALARGPSLFDADDWPVLLRRLVAWAGGE